MELITRKVMVVAKSEELNYVHYVFREYDSVFNNKPIVYFMATLLPNWDQKAIELNDVGFVECRKVLAMVDSYYSKEEEALVPFKYDNVYINKFIHINESNSVITL